KSKITKRRFIEDDMLLFAPFCCSAKIPTRDERYIQIWQEVVIYDVVAHHKRLILAIALIVTGTIFPGTQAVRDPSYLDNAGKLSYFRGGFHKFNSLQPHVDNVFFIKPIIGPKNEFHLPINNQYNNDENQRQAELGNHQCPPHRKL